MKNTFIPKLKAALALFAAVWLAGCEPDRYYTMPEETDGWVPVYSPASEANTVKSLPPQAIVNAGKVYIKDNLLFQLEEGKGIHVLDVSNPAAPERLNFIAVAGAQEMSIKDNYLYTNNLNDLVTIDVQNVANATLVSRTANVFHILEQNVPPQPGYFECVDASKGVVIGWEKKVIKHPKCIKD